MGGGTGLGVGLAVTGGSGVGAWVTTGSDGAGCGAGASLAGTSPDVDTAGDVVSAGRAVVVVEVGGAVSFGAVVEVVEAVVTGVVLVVRREVVEVLSAVRSPPQLPTSAAMARRPSVRRVVAPKMVVTARTPSV